MVTCKRKLLDRGTRNSVVTFACDGVDHLRVREGELAPAAGPGWKMDAARLRSGKAVVVRGPEPYGLMVAIVNVPTTSRSR